MIKFNGLRPEEKGNKRNNQLPAGAYVCQVLDARIEGNEPDQRLAVLFEVAEGEYKGWYMRKYNAQKEHNTDPSRKISYKGVIRLRIPNPDNKNAQYPESDMRKFNDMTAKFQNCNPTVEFYSDNGFDETKLKGTFIGVIVIDDEFNGFQFTKPDEFANIDDVHNGTAKSSRKRDEQPDPTNAPMKDQRSGMQVVNTEKLPWDQEDRPY